MYWPKEVECETVYTTTRAMHFLRLRVPPFHVDEIHCLAVCSQPSQETGPNGTFHIH